LNQICHALGIPPDSTSSENALAFAIHTVCDIGVELWRAVHAKLGRRYNFFRKVAAITSYLIFTSWDDLLLTLAFAKPPPISPCQLPRPDIRLSLRPPPNT
jgi:hypothetical protein